MDLRYSTVLQSARAIFTFVVIIVTGVGCSMGESEVDEGFGHPESTFKERLLFSETDDTSGSITQSTFGQSYLGLSRQKTIKIFNLGTTAVRSFSFATTGPFQVTTHSCNNSLTVGNHCTVVLTFSPSDAGAVSGSLRVNYIKLGKEVLETVELLGTGLRAEGVYVQAVYVGSTSWSSAFLDYLTVQGVGSSTLGYALPTTTRQTEGVPWRNLNQLSIQFSSNVQVESQDLILEASSSGPAPPSVSGFTYDSTNHVATWTFSSSFGSNKYKITLLESLTSQEGEPLDGDWTRGISNFPSGNGLPGGDFEFQFHVLVGDIDLSTEVSNSDATTVQALVGSNTLNAGYHYFYDLDGSSGITNSDRLHILIRVGETLQNYADP